MKDSSNTSRTALFRGLLAASVLVTGQAFADDCQAPQLPTVPDGASSSLEEMVAGQQAVKAFQTDAQAFRACIDEGLAALKAAATDGDEAAAETFKANTDAYNASVSDEEKLAEDFNAAIRAYKEANPS